MKIQVLGSGCTTCKNLYEITQKAVKEMSNSAEVEYITGDEGMRKIIELGAMNSPVLLVNGKIAMTGFTSDIEKIKEKIKVVFEEK
jgi:small redox-active disulfide protein 2